MGATYASLTPTQQKQLADNDAAMRALILQYAQLEAKAAALWSEYQAVAGPIISSLTNTEIIPNSTGYAGAVDLSAYDVGVLMGYLSALASGWDATHETLATQAVGAINTVGG